MNRLEKELRKRNIVFEADEYDIMRGAEHDVDAELVGIDKGKFLVTICYSEVIDPVLGIYSTKNFEHIGNQDLRKIDMFDGTMQWNCWTDINYVINNGNGEWEEISEFMLFDMWENDLETEDNFFVWRIDKQRNGTLKYPWQVSEFKPLDI